VYARSATAETRKSAEETAGEIEKAVETRDPAEIDRKITRARDTLQIATLALPFLRDILHIFSVFL
jgi:hypothetical protein